MTKTLGLVCLTLLLSLLQTVQAQEDAATITLRLDAVADVFKTASMEATLVVSELSSNSLITHNANRSLIRYSPASTFKIFNSLIALDANVVTSPTSEFKWDGKKRFLDAWNADQTLQSAFRVSCVWCYQEMARKIGTETYEKALANADYGNHQVGDDVDTFWLDRDLQISAAEHVIFIKKLLNGQLAYRKRDVDIVKSLMRQESQTPGYTLYGKTGWTGPMASVGWYVGFLVRNDKTWVFAMNMRMTKLEQATLRKSLTVSALEALTIIKTTSGAPKS